MLSNSSFPELWSPEMVSALSCSLAREHHMQIINIRPWNLLSIGHWRAIPSFQIHCGFTRFQSRVFTLTLWVFFFQSKLDLIQTVDVCHAPPHVFNKIHMTKAASFLQMMLVCYVSDHLNVYVFFYCHWFVRDRPPVLDQCLLALFGFSENNCRHRAGDRSRGLFKSCTLIAFQRIINRFGGLK